ncbi:MAG: trypsin-like peptidase domain-containing protein [Pirellulales bacterium]|nr:trypsin-like peptidase domain-containing protein [Pirellulales bacterium]
MTPIVKAVRCARPSVVNIRGEKTVNAQSVVVAEGQAGHQVNGMGTGVVIDRRGYIVTNFHVIDGVHEIQVTLADGRQYIARRIARDPQTDLAVIKIDSSDRLPVLPIGRSSDLMTGETVIAVGNAYGYEHTVTQGIISALHRAVQVSDAQFYSDLIQTDASINPGNSGGPLLNIDGELIGINVAVRAGAQGIGFAIPIDKVLDVISGLLNAQTGKSVQHGLAFDNRATGDDRGLVVASVDKNSPAAEAGIEPGDVLTRVDDLDVAGPIDFERSLLERSPGDRLHMALHRDNKEIDVRLRLAAAPDARPVGSPTWRLLGVELEPIPADDFRRQHKTQYRGGLAVVSVRPGSLAAKQGIHAGDVLVGMHKYETVSLKDVAYVLQKRPDLTSRGPVKFYILRGDNTLYGYFALASKNKITQR